MLSRLVQLSLRHRGVVLILTLGLLLFGSYSARHVKLDVFPEFVQPQVDIQAEAPGLSPEQVEKLVTTPIENSINGVGSLSSVRSESIQGLSVITAVFKEGTDVFLARQMLTERLSELAGKLPAGVKAPSMSALTSSTMDLLKIGLRSNKRTPMELRTFADWTLRPRLLSVPGVARVTVYGGEVKSIQIQVDPAKLAAHGVAISDVAAAAKSATGVLGAGFIETSAQRILIETQSPTPTAESIGQTILAPTGNDSGVLRIRDVATVTAAAEPKFGDALVMGEPGVLLAMAGQYQANTLEVTEAVEAALEDLKQLLESEEISMTSGLHRPANFITTALENVRHSLLIGGLLVAVVLFLFLFDWRTALISFLSIPLSLLSAVMVLQAFGVTIDTMTLGGFAVAIGVVVDDAIIDVENILRRLRENAASEKPRFIFAVIVEASLEVRSAVVYATFIVALVFVPVLMMSGIQGRFFAPLGVAFILATQASLAVAIFVTPALCHLLLAKARPRAEVAWLRPLHSLQRRALDLLAKAPGAAVSVSLVLLLGALSLVPYFKHELLPEFREGHFVVAISMTPGTSMEEMKRLGEKISKDILSDERIATVEQQFGRAEAGEDTWGPHRSEMHIELKPLSGKEQAAVQDSLRETLAKYPGVSSEVMSFLGDRIGETISGETAQVVVSVYGEDLAALDQSAQAVAALLKSVPGHADVQVKAAGGAPKFVVRLRPEKLAQHQFNPMEVLEAVETAYQGQDVSQIYEGARVFNLTVILQPQHRQDPESIRQLLVANAGGSRLPLHELAHITLEPGRDTIQHDGARRRQVVTCNTDGREVRAFVAEAKSKFAQNIHFPSGQYVVWTGAAEEEAAASRELIIHWLLSFGAIVLLLSFVFKEWRHWVLVLSNLPFGLVGGIAAVALSGGVLSIGSLVGFVTLFGVTARNAIMLISHYEHLVHVEGQSWGLETALRGASERLVPILMTALVTGLGLLPLALGSGEPGREIEGPMAIVILGGLVTSTALNLLVLPVLALKWLRPQGAILAQPRSAEVFPSR